MAYTCVPCGVRTRDAVFRLAPRLVRFKLMTSVIDLYVIYQQMCKLNTHISDVTTT